MKKLIALLLLIPALLVSAAANGQTSEVGVNARIFGMLPTATAAANKTALQAAINSCGATNGCEIVIPAGNYNVAPGITFPYLNITISGAGNAMGYGSPNAGTHIIFTAGTVGFDLTQITGAGGAGNYTTLRNMSINCNAVCAYPIKASGMVLLEHLNVSGSTAAGAGIWLYDRVNMTRLSHVSTVGNLGYGLAIGGLGAGTASNTVMSIDHFVSRSNLVGVRIEQAQHLTMKDAVIESNTHEGMQIYQRTGQTNNNLEFDNVWLEANYTGGTRSNYNLTIDSQTHDYSAGPPYSLIFRNSRVAASGSVGAINIQAVQKALFENSSGSGAVTLGTYATAVGFYNWNGGTITDTGNRNWTGGDGRGKTELGGPSYSGLNTKALNVLGTGTGTVCPSGTPTTVYKVNSSSQMMYYIVFVKMQTSTASASNYAAYAIIGADTTATILQQHNGALLTISLSGLAIQVTQSTGASQTVEVLVTTFFPVM